MIINSITIKNVRSFNEETTINFKRDLNILIGPNGGGKSNLLDIINISIRRHLLFNYTLQTVEMDGRTVKSIQQTQSIDAGQLTKFYGNPNDNEIYFKISFTKDDYENIFNIKKNIDRFKLAYDKYHQGYQNYFIQVANWELDDSCDREIDIYIKNNNLDSQKNKLHRKYLEYLNMFHFFFTLAIELPDIKLKPLILFFGPYRSLRAKDLTVTLSETNFSQEYAQAYIATSKSSTSFVRLATTYWGQIRLDDMYDAKDIGYIEKWESNRERILIKSFLNKIGYDWDLDTKLRNNNTFSILLNNRNKEIQLDDASSGEKEIINFIFGILSLNINNGIILIDEPELHLHPKWQKFLLNILKGLARETNNQFIISTHSTSFIDAESLESIIRIYKNGNGSSKIAEPNSTFDLKDTVHIINQTNNEKIFFAELVILVEGITDRLVFQRIFKEKISSNSSLLLEIIDINGKYFYEKYKSLLEAFDIPSYFIADQDYLCNKAGENIQDLFITDIRKIDKNIKDKNSRDHERLITKIEAAISYNNFNELKEYLEVLKKEKRKLKPESELDSTQIKKLETCINDLKNKNIFVLRNGDIEKYFPEGYKKKDLDKVIKLLSDEVFPTWQETNGYQLLSQIADEILENYNKRSARTM